MSADVARSYGGDGGGGDHPLHTMYPAVAWVALLTETQFDLRPYMESPDWTEINTGIQNIARATQNRKNRAKSAVISRQGSRSLARLRDDMEEMKRLEATGTYTDDEINRLARGGKQRGHISVVGRVLPARATASPSTPAHESTLNSLHKKVDFMMSLLKSDSKYSDIFSQFESGGASGSGGEGTRRRVPIIRMTRMRIAMAILSCVIYRGKPIGNGDDTGLAARTKSNKNNGDGDGDNVEQNKLMASDFLLYPILFLLH
nr:F-box domain, leucine-rich repeat domain, L domain-like protein [Tanacetum cinerariifolium]